jgi:L-fucose mutarotase/ribose pyranase (RbsD/FucU family)
MSAQLKRSHDASEGEGSTTNAPSAKRVNASAASTTADTETINQATAATWVAALDDVTLEQLVIYATMKHRDVRDQVLQSYNAHLEEEERRKAVERARVVDFSRYSGDAWYVLNKKYESSRGSVEYDRSWDATREV